MRIIIIRRQEHVTYISDSNEMCYAYAYAYI
jgi:hypothetical protein